MAFAPRVGSLRGNVEGESSWEAKAKMKMVIPHRGGLVGLCKIRGTLRGRAKAGEEGEVWKGLVLCEQPRLLLTACPVTLLNTFS